MQIEIGVLIGILGTVFGIIFGYIGYSRSNKHDYKEDGRTHAELKTNLEYIRHGVDDIKLDLKAQELRVTELHGNLIRIEEMTKSAHKRIDVLEVKQ